MCWLKSFGWSCFVCRTTKNHHELEKGNDFKLERVENSDVRLSHSTESDARPNFDLVDCAGVEGFFGVVGDALTEGFV